VQRIWALLFTLVIAAGITAGYLAAPSYHAPHEAGQGRLRKRAEQFYRSLRVMDYGAAVKLMTPARQYGDIKELQKQIASAAEKQAKVNPKARGLLSEAADKINGSDLHINIIGNWALVGGTGQVPDNGAWVSLKLEDTVWLCVDGDWWNFGLTNPELIAYGNPPDFVRKELLKNTTARNRQDEFDKAYNGQAEPGSVFSAPPGAKSTAQPKTPAAAQQQEGGGA
jgi:hypothetical protein